MHLDTMWEKLFSSEHLLVAFLDVEFNFIQVNRAYALADDREPDFFPGKNHFDLYPNDENERLFKEVVNSARAHTCYAKPFEYQDERRGVTYWDWTLEPIVDEGGRVATLLLTLVDVTGRIEAEEERLRLERDLRQAQKMQAVGTLAGGIAHDFNNILTAIIGYSEMIRDSLPAESEQRADIMEVLKISARAKELTRRILLFSREKETELKPLHLTSVVREALELFKVTLPPSIEIIEDLHAVPDVVNGNSIQLLQVLLNLFTNAEFAMRSAGGVLRVELDTVTVDTASAVRHSKLRVGDYVRLSVRDTGEGMPEKVAERVFEPFFTTKPVGQGTGMGLSVSHGIVEAHEGAMTFDTEAGRGTSFHVYLPVCEASDKEEAIETEGSLTGNARLLLVDDEPAIVAIASRVLTSLGYDVTACTDPEEALALCSAQPESFDALLTDHTMPGMSGIELIQAIRSIRPNMPTILCTGYSQVTTETEARAAGASALLEKPYSGNAIALVVRRVLRLA